MSKKKQVEVVVVSYETYCDLEFVFPSKYMFVCGLGMYNFIKTSKRQVATDYVKEHYDGKYSIREV